PPPQRKFPSRLKATLPYLFTLGKRTVFKDSYGPYQVNPEKGALLAVQYDLSSLKGDYELTSRIYEDGDVMVSETRENIIVS
ncbi:MAG: hypothetical protein AABX05_01275, partial [Nanoarchaeota archaeon]